jgi:hypothetical protein
MEARPRIDPTCACQVVHLTSPDGWHGISYVVVPGLAIERVHLACPHQTARCSKPLSEVAQYISSNGFQDPVFRSEVTAMIEMCEARGYTDCLASIDIRQQLKLDGYHIYMKLNARDHRTQRLNDFTRQGTLDSPS